MNPDSNSRDIGEATDSLELKLSVSEDLCASGTLNGDTFLHDCGAVPGYILPAVSDVAIEVLSNVASFSSLLDGSGDFLRYLGLKKTFINNSFPLGFLSLDNLRLGS